MVGEAWRRERRKVSKDKRYANLGTLSARTARLFARALPPIFTHSSSCARHTMVRLITHNLLACHAKGCTSNNFPLQFKDVQVELREAEFNPDFLRGFLPRLEWSALVDAARQVRFSPITAPTRMLSILLSTC